MEFCYGKIKWNNTLLSNTEYQTRQEVRQQLGQKIAELEQKIQAGDAAAKYRMGMWLVQKQEDLSRAVTLFSEAAEAQPPIEGALTELIKLLRNPAVKHDCSNSLVELFSQRAVEEGDKDAAEALGDIYAAQGSLKFSFSWPPVQTSSDLAIHYYKIASNDGHMDCPAKFKLLKTYADQEDKNSTYKVGMAYLKGHEEWGVEENLAQGRKYLELAAFRGHQEAALYLAQAEEWENGLTTSQPFYQLAATQGNTFARLVLFANNSKEDLQDRINITKRLINIYTDIDDSSMIPRNLQMAESYEEKLKELETQTRLNRLEKLDQIAHNKRDLPTAINTTRQLIDLYTNDNLELNASLKQKKLTYYQTHLLELDSLFKEKIQTEEPERFVSTKNFSCTRQEKL